MAVSQNRLGSYRRGATYDFDDLLANNIFDDARRLDRRFSSLARHIHHLKVDKVSDGLPRMRLAPAVWFGSAFAIHAGADGRDGNAMGNFKSPSEMAESDSPDAQLWDVRAPDLFLLVVQVHADCLVKGLLEHGSRVGL